MPDGIGYLTVLAAGVESVSNTPVNTTQRLRNLEFTPDKEYTFLPDESLGGHAFQPQPDLGIVDIRGSWRLDADYKTADVILTHFFGSLASGRYTFADALVNTLTLAIDKQVSVWELSGVFINQLVLSLTAGVATLSGTLIAMGATYSGGQNTATELANLLPPSARRCKSAPDLTVRIGVDTAALTATENIKIQDGTITLNRTMAETHESGTRNIRKPVASGFATGEFALTLIRYDTNQYKTWLDANTALQLDLLFDEEGGSGTKDWHFPRIHLVTAPNPVSDPQFISQTLTGGIDRGDGTYIAATISAAAADNSINDSAAAFPFIHPGAKLWTSGFTGTASNNEQRTVVSRTASKIILSGGTALVIDAAGETVTVYWQQPPVYVAET